MLDVLKITKDILKLPNAYTDGDVNVNLQKAIDYLNLYNQEEIFQRRLQPVRDMVDEWLGEYDAEGIVEYKQYRENDIEYFNFNDEYIFKINTIKNIDKLIGFVKFVMNTYVPQTNKPVASVEEEVELAQVPHIEIPTEELVQEVIKEPIPELSLIHISEPTRPY